MLVAALARAPLLHRILHRLCEMVIGHLQVMLRRNDHTVADPGTGDVGGELVCKLRLARRA
ncbi:MAG: hypothetical protein V3T84_02230 [Phycisphaerales bacterium]